MLQIRMMKLYYMILQFPSSPSAAVPVAPFMGAVKPPLLPSGIGIPATAPNAVEVELTVS